MDTCVTCRSFEENEYENNEKYWIKVLGKWSRIYRTILLACSQSNLVHFDELEYIMSIESAKTGDKDVLAFVELIESLHAMVVRDYEDWWKYARDNLLRFLIDYIKERVYNGINDPLKKFKEKNRKKK